MTSSTAVLIALLSTSLLGINGPHEGPRELAEHVRAQQPKTEVKSDGADAPAWRPAQASDVLVMIKGFYDGTQDLEAKFVQHYSNPTFGERHTSKGKLQAKKPGQMIWDQSDKADPDYYTDGATLWMVEHDTRQVIKTQVNGSSEVDAAVKLLFESDKLLREYDVRYAKPERTKRYGDADHYVLELRPKQAGKHRYKGLTLIVHASTGRVDGLVVYNTDGSTNHYEFAKVRTNVGLSDEQFRYRRPRNYVESVE